MNKLTNIIGIIVGVIGILLAFYFHYTTKENKEISYHIIPESYKIYDKDLVSESNSISLYKNDSLKIEKNVFLSTFSIWNSGNQPIPPKDVRKTINIKFQGIEEILDLKIIKNIDPEISKLSIMKTSDSIVELQWKYFDPGDGIKFQILYTGNQNLTSNVDGKILLSSIKEFVPKKRSGFINAMLFFGLLAMITLFIGLYAILFKKPIFPVSHIVRYANSEEPSKQNYAKRAKVFNIIMLIIYLIIIPIFIYQYYFNENFIPF